MIRIMTHDEKLEKKYWSKEAQKLDDFYSDNYFKQSTCIIPFYSFGSLWIFMSVIAQFSDFYHDVGNGLIRPRKILINIMIVCGKTSLIPQLMVGNYIISISPR